MGTLEVANVGRKIGRWKVIHAFIKACMESYFDTVGVRVEPEDVRLGVREIANKDTEARVIAKAAGAFARRADPDTCAKSAEFAELWFVSRVETFESGRAISFGRETIFDAKVVVKSIRPEARTKGRASEHGAKGIANGLVSAFNGTVLV